MKSRIHRNLSIFALVLLALSACKGKDPATGTAPAPSAASVQTPSATFPASAEAAPACVLSPASHHELDRFFAVQNYDLQTLDQGVPPFILGRLPNDLNQISPVTERKRIFFLSLLPMVLMVNDEIEGQRRDLIDLLAKYDAEGFLPEGEVKKVADLARDYKVKKNPVEDPRAREKLLKRMDVLPPSLVLAQAANESAWGTSRFARFGNNLFGEWTFIPGTGIVPKERPPGETYEVRRFTSLFDSVRSYMRNLNTHPAYRPLRDRRASLRVAGEPLRGMELAEGLKLYSARSEEYVAEIRDIIRANGLALLSSTSLRHAVVLPADLSSGGSGCGLLSAPLASSRNLSRSDTLPD